MCKLPSPGHELLCKFYGFRFSTAMVSLKFTLTPLKKTWTQNSKFHPAAWVSTTLVDKLVATILVLLCFRLQLLGHTPLAELQRRSGLLLLGPEQTGYASHLGRSNLHAAWLRLSHSSVSCWNKKLDYGSWNLIWDKWSDSVIQAHCD